MISLSVLGLFPLSLHKLTFCCFLSFLPQMYLLLLLKLSLILWCTSLQASPLCSSLSPSRSFIFLFSSLFFTLCFKITHRMEEAVGFFYVMWAFTRDACRGFVKSDFACVCVALWFTCDCCRVDWPELVRVVCRRIMILLRFVHLLNYILKT